jgi:hypothetical protein
MNAKDSQKWHEKVPAEVFGCLIPGELRIVVVPGNGLANGGAPWDVPIEIVPAELRMPNTHLWVCFNDEMKKIIQVWRREE